MLTMEGDRPVEMLLETSGHFYSEPALSPNGRWLAYRSNETGTGLIYVRPFPNTEDGQWRVSHVEAHYPVWSPDGRELFYSGLADTGMMVAQVETEPTFSSRTPEPLFSLTGYAVGAGGAAGRRFDVAPNGNRFIMRKVVAATETGDDAPFNGLIFVENWFEELTARVPVP